MIDLHCHILPGVDDGPEQLEESLTMAAQAVADGIHTVVATPHTLNGVYELSFDTVCRRVEALQAALDDRGLALTLRPGLEVHFCDRLAQRLLSGQGGSLNGNGRYVLLEMPLSGPPPDHARELFELRLGGLIPILAHPERNPRFQQAPRELARLVETGCLVQVTAASITGELGEAAMRCAHGLLVLGLVHVIASDAHDTRLRPVNLSRGLAAAAHLLGSTAAAQKMVTTHPEAVLQGEALAPADPVPTRHRPWWRFWGRAASL